MLANKTINAERAELAEHFSGRIGSAISAPLRSPGRLTSDADGR
jgi:hypothetical protein